MSEYIEETLTLAEFSKRFVNNSDFSTPTIYDLDGMGIEVETENGFKQIKSFLVKLPVSEYYSDGKLNGTAKHRVMEEDKEIFLESHPEFKKIQAPMDVVDIEVDGGTYLANGRNNHNTTSGGKAIAYHSSVRLRMKSVGQIKLKDAVVGVRTKTVVVKNRMGPPAKSTEFNIFFDSGMDKYSNWVDELLALGVLKNSTKKVDGEDGGKKKTKIQQEAEKKEAAKAKSLKFTIESSNREVIFDRKDFVKLITDDQEAYNYLYGKLCDESIMKYKTSDSDMSDMVCTDDGSISDE
jgi:hypothetical protein